MVGRNQAGNSLILNSCVILNFQMTRVSKTAESKKIIGISFQNATFDPMYLENKFVSLQ